MQIMDLLNQSCPCLNCNSLFQTPGGQESCFPPITCKKKWSIESPPCSPSLMTTRYPSLAQPSFSASFDAVIMRWPITASCLSSALLTEVSPLLTFKTTKKWIGATGFESLKAMQNSSSQNMSAGIYLLMIRSNSVYGSEISYSSLTPISSLRS